MPPWMIEVEWAADARLSPNRRLNWHLRHALEQQAKALIKGLVIQADWPAQAKGKRRKLTITVRRPRRLDWSNEAGGPCKPVIDGVQAAGALLTDGPVNADFELRIAPRPGPDHTSLLLEDLP